MITTRRRSPARPASLLLLPGLALTLALLGPPAATARGQWVVSPGFGAPFGGFGYGYGSSYGFGPTYAGVGYGFGSPLVGWPYGAGYGVGPYAFSMFSRPEVQDGLAYNAMATGRVAPYAYPAGPFGFGSGLGYGPYGFAGSAYYNPYFASGLTPLAVQSARDELILRSTGTPVRFRVVPVPVPAPPAEPEDCGPVD